MPIPILHFRRKDFDLSRRTLIMGVLNVTPDSFSDGGRFYQKEEALNQAQRLAEEGADILDIGGESTRPGARPVPEEEEAHRVIPVIEELAPRLPIPISIDTRKMFVAQRALESGAEMINDVSALRHDAGMAGLAAQWKAPLVLMHMRGSPETMQSDTVYQDLTGEILDFFRERLAYAEGRGIRRDRIILDPGIGFGKSLAEGHNLILLKHLSRFRVLGQPLLVGPSRKAFIGRILGGSAEEREDGTLAAAAIAVYNGANIVRVHEVKRTRRIVDVVDAIVRSASDHPASEFV